MVLWRQRKAFSIKMHIMVCLDLMEARVCQSGVDGKSPSGVGGMNQTLPKKLWGHLELVSILDMKTV